MTFGPLASILDISPGLTVWTLVTFALVFAVLRWKAWGPILQLVKKREESVQSSLDTAQTKLREAETLFAKRQQELEGARQEAERLLEQNRVEVAKLREELIVKSRAEAEEIVARAKAQIEQEKARALVDIRGSVVDLAMAGARRLVEVSLDETRQRALVNEYLEKLDAPPRA